MSKHPRDPGRDTIPPSGLPKIDHQPENPAELLPEKLIPDVPTPRLVARIDTDLCTGCEACYDFCPIDCITVIPGIPYERIGAVCTVDETTCAGCFICLEYCRWDALGRVPLHPDETEPHKS